MSSSRYCFLLLAASVVAPADAYELGTHGRLTFEAYKRSVIKADSSLLRELGVKDDSNPFGTTYYDVAGDQVRSREKHDFEESARRMPEEVDPLSVPGWLLRGAIREDDYVNHSLLCRIEAPNPQDDPYPDPPDRPLSHFYDPVFDRQLTLSQPINAFLGHRQKAPDWATGAIDAFDRPNEPNASRRNHFTVFDAREAMYRALTGKSKGNTDVAETKEERNRYWATSVRALGDVVHLIQDMAVPHHTRNDAHSGACFPSISGHASVFENYIEARATQSGDARERTQTLDPTIVTFPTLNYDNYPTARFTKYADIFSTARRDGVERGFGLADYSNRGFFSTGTNLGDNPYPLPSNNRNHYAEQVISVDPRTGAKTAYLLDAVFDTLNPALRRLDVPKTKEGIWYDTLAGTVGSTAAERFGYTLDQRIYDAQADLLIPRAVAYSAGLIDYFFRGRLEAQDVSFAERNGRVEVSLKVRNAIDAEKLPEWAGESLENRQGNPSYFVLTVKYKQGEEEKLVASDPVDFKDQELIKPGETSQQVYTFSLPILPEDATDIEYRIVFRGRLGQEDDAIAVGLVEQVSGFLVQPNYLPDDRLGGQRLITKTAGTWRLSREQGLQAANIDWKGGYVNGRPTKVLTWWGPAARYFPNPPSLPTPFQHQIYQNGERFAVAPCSVLGAAVARDAQDKEWLVIICNRGASDAVFRRPNTKSDSIALFDPITNPDGWQEIATFPWQSNSQPPNRPWFFNGDGSEAQTMRQFQNANKLDRLLIRIELDAPSAQLTNLGNLEGITDSTTVKHMVQGATPPGLCDRDKSASGHEHRESRLTRTLSGGYVLVVDYDNKTEILGTIVASGTNEFVQILDQDWNCVGDRLEQESATMQITQIAGESTEFRFATQGKVIPVRKQTGSASATLAKLSSDSTWLTGSGTATITDFRLLSDLYYLDLRHGLYVAREGVNRNLSSTGAIADKQVCITRTGEASSLQQISYVREITIDKQITDAAASFCSSNVNLLPGVTPIFSNPGVEATLVIFPTLPIRTVEGSWVVNSGELFASQEYRDKDSNLKVFNFLTDGDPKALIPTAPEEPRYFPIYVVK